MADGYRRPVAVRPRGVRVRDLESRLEAGRTRRESIVYLLAYAGLAFVPAALFLGAAKAFDWWTRAGSRPRSGPVSMRPPIERLVSDLRRLERDYSRIQGSDLPRQASRLQSVSLAYDDTLCACCAALEIPTAGQPPLNAMQRLEMEAALARHGLTW